MQIDTIIAALRTRCAAVFGNNVAGAAEFKGLDETAALPLPCAFVIPMDDNPGDNTSANGTRQILTETIAVVVALSNAADQRGQAGAHSMHSVRAALLSALMGWQPTDDHDPFQYTGGTLLAMDRARLFYQFEFSADYTLDETDGYQAGALASLPHFDGGTATLDMAPENVPDGLLDAGFVWPKTGNLPT